MEVTIEEWVKLSAAADQLRAKVKSVRSQSTNPLQKNSLQAVIDLLETFEKYCCAMADGMAVKNDPPAESERQTVHELLASYMPIRHVNLLFKGGYNTFEDLERVNSQELLKIVGLGRKTLGEIRVTMRVYGYYFANERKALEKKGGAR